MHELDLLQLERSATASSLAPQTTELAATSNGHRLERQRRRCQPMDQAGPPRRCACPPAPTFARCPPPTLGRASRLSAGVMAAWPRSLWVPRPAANQSPFAPPYFRALSFPRLSGNSSSLKLCPRCSSSPQLAGHQAIELSAIVATITASPYLPPLLAHPNFPLRFHTPVLGSYSSRPTCSH
jgi:hypothetical protein